MITILLVWCVVSVPVALVAGRFIYRARLLAEMRAEQLCTQDCGRSATHERFEGATTDGIPIVDLVCRLHAGTEGRPR